MKRANFIAKLFRKKESVLEVATFTNDIEDANSSVPSRGSNVPTVLGVVKAGVKVVNTVSSPWPPIQSITAVLEYFINNHVAWLKNQTASIYLVRRLKDLEKCIYEGGTSEIHDRFIPRIRQLERDLQRIKDKAIANQYLATSEIADALNEVVKDIGDVILDYQTSLQEAILDRISLQIATVLRLLVDDQKIIWTLPRARDANHLSEKHKRCLPGTRTKILLNLEAWARDPRKRTVYWLNGHAGSGKSTISQSFCYQAFADGMLGASFFCSRDTENRSDLDMIFPTLSFQLACRFPEIRLHIVEALKSRPDLAKESLNNQLEALLIRPLEQSSLSTLIVIDALDECKDSEPTSVILSLLSQHIQRIPHVKWFITGRPDPVLRQGFRTPGLRPITETFILHDVTASDIDHDISLYLTTRLSEGFKERSTLHLPEVWPPEEEIRALTIKCERLFIFASTAVTYIRSPFHHPAIRLSSLCSSEGSTSEHGRLGLDQLYATVLEVGYGNAGSADHERIRTVIASVVLAFNPIPVDELAELLDTEASSILILLRMLHAVLRVPPSNDRPITLYHKSFFDYITDDSRCINPKFHVDPSIQHCMLVNCCLRLMNSRLKRNLCSLPSYAMNTDLDSTERWRRIGGALVYACCSWVTHLTLARISPYTLELLGFFLKEHFIHWMEVMSLIDKFTFVIKLLHDVHNSLITLTSTPEAENADITELLRWLYDGRKLASEFREAVQMSASHFYHSALPLSPKESLLRNLHSTALESEVRIIHGNLSKWSYADMTISVPPGYRSRSLVFSHNGKLFATVCDFVDVYIYDVTTGQCIHKFQGNGICFAPDDTLIALARGDGSALLWDLRTGIQSAINPSELREDRSECRLAFSPNGQLLSIGREDAIVIWNVDSCQREWEIKGKFYQSEWFQDNPPSLIVLQSDGILIQVQVFTNISTVLYQKKPAVNRAPLTSRHPYYPATPLHFYLSLKHGLIAIECDCELYLMNIESRRILYQWRLNEGNVAFSPLQPLIALCGKFFDITDPTNPQPIPTIEPINIIDRHITFSPTQHIFAIYRSLQIELIPTTGSHFLLPSGSSTPSIPPPYSYKRATQFYPRQLSVSPDASKVILITGQSTETVLHLDEVGITKKVVDIQLARRYRQLDDVDVKSLWPRSMPRKLKKALQSTCLATQPGLFEMEALGVYWQAPFCPPFTGSTGFCCFATSSKNTLVFAIVANVRTMGTQKNLKMIVVAYSLVKEKILARAEWDLPSNSFLTISDIGCINVDTSTRALTMFTPAGISGDWRIIKMPIEADNVETGRTSELGDADKKIQDTTFSHALAPIPSDTFLMLNADLSKIYTVNSSPIQYPVLRSDDGQWIMNDIGQHILWVPYGVQAGPQFRSNWRWCRERLFVASDKGSPDPLIVDFSGVDVKVPTALQVFEKLGWSKIVVSDLTKLEEEDYVPLVGKGTQRFSTRFKAYLYWTDEEEPVHLTASQTG
ncbi:hypothetical protein H0H92_006896 [Tricholoma furcatifolium]|nr:hypothetical protein H0H92_006896 [Tricholoma furcatifolium]